MADEFDTSNSESSFDQEAFIGEVVAEGEANEDYTRIPKGWYPLTLDPDLGGDQRAVNVRGPFGQNGEAFYLTLNWTLNDEDLRKQYDVKTLRQDVRRLDVKKDPISGATTLASKADGVNKNVPLAALSQACGRPMDSGWKLSGLHYSNVLGYVEYEEDNRDKDKPADQRRKWARITKVAPMKTSGI